MESASFIPLIHIFAIVCRWLMDANKWLNEGGCVCRHLARVRQALGYQGLRGSYNTAAHRVKRQSYFGEVDSNRPAIMILVTGGTGFIGSHLVEKLVSDGIRAGRWYVDLACLQIPILKRYTAI